MKKERQFSDKYGKVVAADEVVEEREAPGLEMKAANEEKRDEKKAVKAEAKAEKKATKAEAKADKKAEEVKEDTDSE